MKTIVATTLFVCLVLFIPMSIRLLALALAVLLCVLFPWIGAALVLFGICGGLVVMAFHR